MNNPDYSRACAWLVVKLAEGFKAWAKREEKKVRRRKAIALVRQKKRFR